MQRASSEDMLSLAVMVRAKLRKVLRTNPAVVRTKDNLSLDKTLAEVCSRFDKGEFWHTDEEAARIKNLADWVLAQHCSQQGVPFRGFDFDPERLVAKGDVSAERMAAAMEKIAYN